MENPMEALKQIPQAFFEFFARLVPGFVAFGLWLGLFGGADHWQNVLGMVMVGRWPQTTLSRPLRSLVCRDAMSQDSWSHRSGKLAQRLTEWCARRVHDVRTLITTNPQLGASSSDVSKEPPPLKRSSAEIDDYDWLRAKYPDQGALVAKIRAEYTMFYSVSAVVATALFAQVFGSSPIARGRIAILAVFTIVCAARGFSVTKTCQKTAKKLRNALMWDCYNWRLTRPEHRRAVNIAPAGGGRPRPRSPFSRR